MYQIYTLRQAYKPDLKGIGKPYPMCDYEGSELFFDTLEEAVSFKDDLDEERYVTDNNESGRPEYIVTDTDLSRFEDASNYDWNDAECDCGECAVCFEMMIVQERRYIRSNDCEKGE